MLCSSAAAAAKSLQSCLTLCDPRDGSLPGSRIPGILQARTPEWVAISFSNAWKWKVKVKLLSHVWPSATPWPAAYQAPPSIGFSRQEYWSGVPLPSLINSVNRYKSVNRHNPFAQWKIWLVSQGNVVGSPSLWYLSFLSTLGTRENYTSQAPFREVRPR